MELWYMVTFVVIFLQAVDTTTTEPEVNDVKNVHMIIMNHLDVGYNGIPVTGFINNVLNKYFTEYFPRAVNLSQTFRHGDTKENFIYTTHAWLISLYFDCPPNLILAGVKQICPTDEEKAALQKAIQLGDVTWHAGPMNMQPELMTQQLFNFGLKLSQDLDKRFNIQRKARVFSQRDVPGMTGAVVPLLASNDILGVSVGVNPMTAPPALPKIFRWSFADNEVLATWHAGGYPEVPGPSPSKPGGLSKKDCVVIDGFTDALCFAFRSDNNGPPVNATEVLSYYEILRSEFPNAVVRASRLEDYMLAVSRIRSQLPVVTKEIGDTWIQGIASDPRKMAEYKTVVNILDHCYSEGQCSYNDSRFYNASRFLIKLPEHTWGLPSVHDTTNWTNTDFEKVRDTGCFAACAESWSEQRQFTALTLSALADHPIVPVVQTALAQLTVTYPRLDDYKQITLVTNKPMVSCPITAYSTSSVQIGFALDGSIDYLAVDDMAPLFHGDNTLGEFVYHTYNESDFQELSKHYDYNGNSAGFRKTNSSMYAHPESRVWQASVTHMFQKKDGSCDFWQRRTLIEQETWKWYGAPQEIWVHYVWRHEGPIGLDMTFQLHDKTSTRLPEALSVKIEPNLNAFYNPKLRLQKLGLPNIDPMNVVTNGSQLQHAVESVMLSIENVGELVRISSSDVPLVVPYTTQNPPTVFPTQLAPLAGQVQGVLYNIYNNIWDTNYALWYPYLPQDRHLKATFSIDINM